MLMSKLMSQLPLTPADADADIEAEADAADAVIAHPPAAAAAGQACC